MSTLAYVEKGPVADTGHDRAYPATLPRYEVKIPVPLALLASVDAWVRLHPAHWRVAYPPRQVNNVYFDTPGLSGLNGNLSGIAERTKLRLRWYGPVLRMVTGAQLELKCKQGMAGWKQIAAVSDALDLSTSSWHGFVSALRTATSEVACIWLGRFSLPVLINHYRRAYYATPDGVLRLTVDRDLWAYAQRASGHPNLSQSAPMEIHAVVELKAPVEDESVQRLSKALTGFPVPVDRFSKYVQGMLSGSQVVG